MNPDQACSLLTAELAEPDERARFADESCTDAATDPALDEVLSQHPGDYGTDVTNRMEGLGCSSTPSRSRRRRVQDALAWLDGGTYGRRLVCGREIDDERLEARPEAATRREHSRHPLSSNDRGRGGRRRRRDRCGPTSRGQA